MKRILAFLLAAVLIFGTFPAVFAVEASAASNYTVEQWGHNGTYYYLVHNASSPEQEYTFFRWASDIYTSRDKRIKITFYTADSVLTTDGQAEAFTQYLTAHSKNKYCYSGYYCNRVVVFGESEMYHFAFKIEGWDPKGDIKKLTGQVYRNSEGEELRVNYIDRGDVVAEQWTQAITELYSSIVHLDIPSPKNGVTVGFRFRDNGFDTYKYFLGSAIETFPF